MCLYKCIIRLIRTSDTDFFRNIASTYTNKFIRFWIIYSVMLFTSDDLSFTNYDLKLFTRLNFVYQSAIILPEILF